MKTKSMATCLLVFALHSVLAEEDVDRYSPPALIYRTTPAAAFNFVGEGTCLELFGTRAQQSDDSNLALIIGDVLPALVHVARVKRCPRVQLIGTCMNQMWSVKTNLAMMAFVKFFYTGNEEDLRAQCNRQSGLWTAPLAP